MLILQNLASTCACNACSGQVVPNIKPFFFTFSVCACGKWICTSKKCSEGYTDIFKNTVGDDLDEEEPEDDPEEDYADEAADEDEDEDEEGEDEDTDPEEDPDVQDINWF